MSQPNKIRDCHITLALAGEDSGEEMLREVVRAIEVLFHVADQPGEESDERGHGPAGTVLLTLVSQSVVRDADAVSDLDQQVLRFRKEYPLLGKNVGEVPGPAEDEKTEQPEPVA